jgi:hypothetical protein
MAVNRIREYSLLETMRNALTSTILPDRQYRR